MNANHVLETVKSYYVLANRVSVLFATPEEYGLADLQADVAQRIADGAMVLLQGFPQNFRTEKHPDQDQSPLEVAGGRLGTIVALVQQSGADSLRQIGSELFVVIMNMAIECGKNQDELDELQLWCTAVVNEAYAFANKWHSFKSTTKAVAEDRGTLQATLIANLHITAEWSSFYMKFLDFVYKAG